MLHVCVVDHARVDDLLRCLATLPAACGALPWRLTIVENVAATDLAAVRAAAPQAEVVVNPRPRGFAANHNPPLRRALADPAARYALVLNDDTELPPGSVAALVEHADAHPELGAVAPRAVDRDGVEQLMMQPFPTLGSEFMSALARFPDAATVLRTRDGWLNAACLLLRTEALRGTGLFDERFFLFYEDTDLGLRLRRAGWRLAVLPEVCILHAGHGTVGDPGFGVLMEQQVARSQYLYVRKHHGALAAGALRRAARAARGVRAAKAALEARLKPSAQASEHARFLRELAAYDPRTPLQHEAA